MPKRTFMVAVRVGSLRVPVFGTRSSGDLGAFVFFGKARTQAAPAAR